MNLGDAVRLATFQGAINGPDCTRPDEDYWKLVGHCGIVTKASKNRALVEFSIDVLALGLACHNEAPNSLWISISDLRLDLENRTKNT